MAKTPTQPETETKTWVDKAKEVGACIVLVGFIGLWVTLPFLDTPQSRQIEDNAKAIEMFDKEIKELNPLLHDAIMYVQHRTIPDRHLEAARKLREAAGV